MKLNLPQSPVKFEETFHVYTLNGKRLSGVTSIIHKYITPELYKGVEDARIERARLRGSAIHKAVNKAFTTGKVCEDIKELGDIFKTLREQGYEIVASEYIVSDEKAIASAIDLVLVKNGKIYIADIKCTATINVDYVQWQLSIYRHLFYLQTGIKADGLLVIHVTSEGVKIVEFDAIGADAIKALFGAYLIGADTFINPTKNLPQNVAKCVTELSSIEGKIAKMQQQAKEFRKGMLKVMQDNAIYKIDLEGVSFTRKQSYERTDIDKKKLQELYPETYNACARQTRVSEALQIKLK